jgi:RNA polymerase sigma-70 factor (ECF subfamily)
MGASPLTADADVSDDARALGEAWLDVEAAQGGDRAAFDRLYRAYAPMVHGIVLAHAPASEAEDVVQDAFVVAFAQLPQLRDVSSFGAWLAQIARRQASDRVRRRRPVEPLAAEPRGGVSASDLAEAGVILDAIRTLPAAYRETLALRLVEGMTGPEIALKTGMSAGSVRVNLHRGMAQLRAKLRRTTRGSRSDG